MQSKQSDLLPLKFIQQIPPQAKKLPKELSILPNKFHLKDQVHFDTPIQSLAQFPSSPLLSVGGEDGITRIYDSHKRSIDYILRSQDHSPVTSLSAATSTNTLMLTHSEGTLEYWHATTQQLLFTKKYANMLQCCTLNQNGYAFADNTGTICFGNLNKGNPSVFEEGKEGGHCNRVFCLQFLTSQPNVLLSGGWDNTVYFWDVRSKHAFNSLYGYYIGGNAIDSVGDEILLGNNTAQYQLRIYDMRSMKVRVINWPLTEEKKLQTGVLACSYMNKDIVCITPQKEIRLFQNQRCVSQHINQGEAQLDSMVVVNRKIATGWTDGVVRIFQI